MNPEPDPKKLALPDDVRDAIEKEIEAREDMQRMTANHWISQTLLHMDKRTPYTAKPKPSEKVIKKRKSKRKAAKQQRKRNRK